MNILILGLGKTGTTALLYKVAAGIPNCKAFSGGLPGKYMGDYENAVFKHTYNEFKGKNIELYSDHFRNVHYDRKIWISRDPRDSSISRMLYRWHKGTLGQKKQFNAHMDLVVQKECDPKKIPFHMICQYTGSSGWPRPVDEVLEEEKVLYSRLPQFVNSLKDNWFFFKFEDMVQGNFDALNEFLGFEAGKTTEVPESTGKAKVVRRKGFGDWRNWYTDADIPLFKPIYRPYMESLGYDPDDWRLNANPHIDPEFSSNYIKKLVKRRPLDLFRSLKNQILWKLSRMVLPKTT
jgi:hypothetical protein